MAQITEFKNNYSFLSNFYKSPFTLNSITGIVFPTVEHFYQANKAMNKKDFEYILLSETPAISKKRGREININPDWDNIKLKVMSVGVYQKFLQNKRIQELLIQTGNSTLIEGNYWNDKYWGMCLKSCEGENNLGRLLMHIRSIFQQEYTVKLRINNILFNNGENIINGQNIS